MTAPVPADHPPAIGRDPIVRPELPGLRDVLELADLERPRWAELIRSIEGPVAVSFVAAELVKWMLLEPYNVALAHPFGVRLHLGNPGAAGLEHAAVENAEKTFQFILPGTLNRFIYNLAAIEWTEVKAKEEYKFVSLWSREGTPKFIGYAELSAPIAAEIGDTVRFNFGTLALEIP